MNVNKPSFYFSFSREYSFSSIDAQISEDDSPMHNNQNKQNLKQIENEFQKHQNKSFKEKIKKLFCLK